MCMNVYMCEFTHTSTYIYIHTYICMYVYAYMRTFGFMYVHVWSVFFAHRITLWQTSLCACICIHLHIYIHTRHVNDGKIWRIKMWIRLRHMYIHTYIHTYKRTCVCTKRILWKNMSCKVRVLCGEVLLASEQDCARVCMYVHVWESTMYSFSQAMRLTRPSKQAPEDPGYMQDKHMLTCTKTPKQNLSSRVSHGKPPK